jgi:hypothetical protein
VRRHFFFAVLTLILITFSHTANPEDKATEAEVMPAEPVEAVAVVTEEKPQESPGAIVILDGVLPEGAVTQGKWDWDASLRYNEAKSHTEPPANGVTEHSYRIPALDIPGDNNIEQYIYLDPGDPPEGILLRFRLESEGKEGEIGVYREGEQEVFIFNDDEAVIYDGTLPEPGSWSKWGIDPDDLGLRNAKITGFSFAVYGGRVNWGLLQFAPSKKYKDNSQPEAAGN